MRELGILLAVVACALLPFLDKAFTIDDPLFLWLGQHLQRDPIDFFGFAVNWYGTERPMYEVTRNPPLTAYYIALAAAVLGWGERALHTAFLLPALCAAAGIWAIARRLCAHPLAAALLAVFTPAFLVSSTNVMCDTMLLAFWCAAVACWLEGLRGPRPRASWLAAASGLVVLASLTKYFGLALVPLLFVHGLARERRLGRWAAWLLLVPAALGLYEGATRWLYGTGHLFEAAVFASDFRELAEPDLGRQVLLGLVYLGASLAPALCFAPLLWPRWSVAWGLGLLLASALLADPLGRVLRVAAAGIGSWNATRAFEVGLWALGGLSALALAVSDAARRRDPERWLLLAWMVGTAAFAALLNWTNNARSNLPMAPALAILLVRRLECVGDAPRPWVTTGRVLAFAASAVLALLVTWGDWQWAGGVRDAAREMLARGGERGAPWFTGHWGFQYYMEQGGAKALDWRHDTVRAGDLLVFPVNNADTGSPPEKYVTLVEEAFRRTPWVATVSRDLGAGFYSSTYAILPFVLGAPGADAYQLWEARKGFRPRSPRPSTDDP